ncbi:MAG: hypothetical protein ABSE62_15975 [Chthoniobacteraceae bacterium]|jgi:hypothetical protein
MPIFNPDHQRRAQIRTLLAVRSWCYRDLAEKAGITADLCRHVCTGLVNRRARVRIEDALGLAIWATLPEFKLRQDTAAFYGFEIELLTVPQLSEKIRGLGIKPEWNGRRESLVAILKNHFQSAGAAGTPANSNNDP